MRDERARIGGRLAELIDYSDECSLTPAPYHLKIGPDPRYLNEKKERARGLWLTADELAALESLFKESTDRIADANSNEI